MRVLFQNRYFAGWFVPAASGLAIVLGMFLLLSGCRKPKDYKLTIEGAGKDGKPLTFDQCREEGKYITCSVNPAKVIGTEDAKSGDCLFFDEKNKHPYWYPCEPITGSPKWSEIKSATDGAPPLMAAPGEGKLLFLQKQSTSTNMDDEICSIDNHGVGHIGKGHTLKECTDEIFKDQ